MRKIIIPLFLYFAIYFNCIAQDKILVIDPGHNWDNTTGMLTPLRTETEVNTNWEVANKLKNEIEMLYHPSYGLNWLVELTREDNNPGSNVTLDDREEFANNLELANRGKVYFLSIHCNANGGTGTETFYCNNTFSPNDNLIFRYAQNIQDNMVEHGEWTSRRCVEDHDYYDFHLGVLDNLTMPNCLNEIGFVDSDDKTKLLEDNWRNKFAQAYFEGFRETFADLNIISYNIEQRPCYVCSPSLTWCKINVVLKDTKLASWNGEVRATLKYLPMYSYESPTNEHCKLGSTQSLVLGPSDIATMTFQGNVPTTMDLGLALQLESRKSGSLIWEKISATSHRKIIKIPVNGALINGTLHNNYVPLQGSVIWSNKYIKTKASNIANDPLTSIYEPTSDRSDKKGYFELLIPYEWETGVVSVKNDPKFDEAIISPITDKTLTFENSSLIIIPTETCNDGIQNQDEIGVDCGGVCPPCGIGGNLVNSVSVSECKCGSSEIPYDYNGAAMTSGLNIINKEDIKITHGVYYYSGAGEGRFRCNDIVYDGKSSSMLNGGIYFEENGFRFAPDKMYKMKFNYWSFNLNPVYFKLANGLTNNLDVVKNPDQSSISYQYFSTQNTPPTPSNSYYIGYVSGSYGGCTVYEDDEDFRYYELSITFKPDDYYSQLWVYTNTTTKFNSLKLEEICVADFIYNDNTTTVYNPTRASNSIIIKDFAFNPENSVNFIAGRYILIKNGTTISSNSGGSANFSINENICPNNEKVAEIETKKNIPLNIFNNNNNKIVLYPNPTEGLISIINYAKEKYSVSMYDCSGKLIENFSRCEGTTKIDMINYAKGVYFIKIFSSSSTFVRKVIKK